MKFSTLVFFHIMSNILICKDSGSRNYQTLSAKEKMDDLWKQITADTQSADWYGATKIASLFTECLDPTFEEESDVLPDGRLKVIHTVGIIAKAEFVPISGHPYTGMLKSGNTNVLLRLSTAKAYDTSDTTPQGAFENFVPGLSLKFLVDGKPSTNQVAMYSTSGQPSWNFFKNDLTPQFDIQYANMTFAENLVAAKFSSKTNYISTLGMKELCGIMANGTVIDDDKINIPFKLIFRPSDEVKSIMNDSFTSDYKEVVSALPIGTTIYEVYAVERPDCIESLIGEIRLTSQFTTSKFADLSLFFKHASNNEDFVMHGEWIEYRDYWGIFQKVPGKKVPKHECPFASLLNLYK
jgi:hypothetical protein